MNFVEAGEEQPYGVGARDFTQQHVIRVLNSTDVTLVNVSVVGASGDGMYIAGVRGKGHPPSPNQGSLRVLATNVLCANNSRNALSVIACVDCLFENCAFTNTRGAEPMAGVDLEPNGPVDSLHNITFRGCVSRNNGGGGFNIYTGKWIQSPPSLPMKVIFERSLVVASRKPRASSRSSREVISVRGANASPRPLSVSITAYKS